MRPKKTQKEVADEIAEETTQALANVSAPDKFTSINDVLCYIQCKLVAPKSKTAQGKTIKFNFRSAEDVLYYIKPFLWETQSSVSMNDEAIVVGNRIFMRSVATLHFRDETREAVGYAELPPSRPAMDISQSTGASMSYARKYALGGLFAIDSGAELDPDASTKHSAYGSNTTQAQATPAPQAPAEPKIITHKGKSIDADALTRINSAKTIEELRTVCATLRKEGFDETENRQAYYAREGAIKLLEEQKEAPAPKPRKKTVKQEQPTEEPAQADNENILTGDEDNGNA